MIDRRQLLKGAAAGGAALVTAPALGRTAAHASARAFSRPLAVPPVVDLRRTGTVALTMTGARHDFGLGAGPTWCYQAPGAAPTVLGPTLVARRGVPVTLHLTNALGSHPLAPFVDEGLDGVSAADRTAPRAGVHLHGGNVEPGSDGGPLATLRPGETRTYSYANDQESAALWYHDHALGLTRLNVWAGLAGGYLLRDANDPGDGSTGLPHGRYEVPLVLQDRLLTEDGALTYPLGEGRTWAPEAFGDVPTVNGTAWPDLRCDRTRYRFRVFNGSNARVYDLRLRVLTTGEALPFHAIGTDGGLLDAPVPLTSLVLGPGERADLLVDLSRLPRNAVVRLSNRARAPYPDGPRAARRGGSPLPDVLQLTAAGPVVAPPPLPRRLRARTAPVPRLAAHVTASTRVRTRTLVEVLAVPQPLEALLDDRRFRSEDFAATDQHVLQDSLEVWELVNTTGDAHPIHLHLVQFQVLSRQRFDVGACTAAALPHGAGEPGNPYPPPPVTPYLRGPSRPPPPHEAGWKDTVLALPGEVTRIAVPFGQPAGVPPVASPRVWPTTAAGTDDYVWHCHVLEHEDNDMMQRYRVR